MKFSNFALVLAATTAIAEAQFMSFDFVARTYHAAGYTEAAMGAGQPDLFGFGLGGLEQIAYDPTHMIVYGVSEQGFVSVIDFGNGPGNAKQLDFALTSELTFTDVDVCGGFLFVGGKDDPKNGAVTIYKVAQRGADGTITPPELLHTIEVGAGPDMLKHNDACDMMAVANEGEGVYDDGYLVDPEGSVSIIMGPFDGETLEVVQVSLNNWSDEELIAKGVHLPLPLNALEYWDDFSAVADALNFTEARANYQAASNLEPEYLAWSADGATLFVSLQENSAIVTVDVASGTATEIYSLGLKDWSTVGIDVIEDDGFTPVMLEGFFTTRSQDSITTFTKDGATYIVTANEGDDKSYGDYEERLKAGDIFAGGDLPPGMTADSSVFDPMNITMGISKYFNDACNDTHPETPFCSGSMRVTTGSSMIDYSDPSAPNIIRFVGLGGRGLSIFKFSDAGLELVWDSADELETAGAAAYPWAHNSLQDEEYAPIDGTLFQLGDDDLKEVLMELNDPAIDGCEDQGNGTPGACPMGKTVDERSLKDGPAAETAVVGAACGSMFMVTAAEKNSVGYLYNIDDVTAPELVQVFHLSEASETMSPGLAYDNRVLGEIDPESIHFLEAEMSPTGKAAVMFAGAFSGTISYWELNCEGDVVSNTTTPEKPTTTTPEEPTTPETPATNAPEGESPSGTTASASSGAHSFRLLMSSFATVVVVVVGLWN